MEFQVSPSSGNTSRRVKLLLLLLIVILITTTISGCGNFTNSATNSVIDNNTIQPENHTAQGSLKPVQIQGLEHIKSIAAGKSRLSEAQRNLTTDFYYKER